MTSGRAGRSLPVAAVLVVAAVGLVLIATDHWRRGATALGAAAALAAVLRLVVPERWIGVLAVRSRVFDVAFALVLAVGFTVLVLQR
jgi:hypothetical protein